MAIIRETLIDKVSLTEIHDDDVSHVVDISDVTSSPQGTSKKMTWLFLKGIIKSYLEPFYEKFKVSANDTTPGYLNGKLVAGSNVTLVENNDGGDETLTISASTDASPLTTKGDLFTFDTGDARLPIGTDGQTIVADSGESLGIKWSTPAGGGDMTKAVYDPTTKEVSAFVMENMTYDDTDFIVADETDAQLWADKIDAAVLKTRGTGVTSTYVSTVSIGGTTFAQPAVKAEIQSDEGYFSINYAGATGITVSNLAATSTYVYLDNTGALQQQTSIPTRQDWSRKVFTMRIAVNTSTNQIINFEYLNNPIGHYANSIRDLYTYLLAQGVPFKIGQVITGRADNLGFNIGAGSLMEFGGTGDINNANIKSFDAVSNVTYSLLSRTATVGTDTNLVKFWDNAGTITALGSTTCVGHRVYRFSSGGVAIQYGQGNYANMTLAKTGSRLEEYVLNPVLEDATFMGWWLLEETATVTSGTADAEFVEYVIGIQGGSSSTLSGCLLKGNNLSDLLDAALARTNIGLATTVNQTDSTDKRFMTDAQETKLDGLGTGELIGFAFSDETTDLAVGTSKISFQMPNFATTLTGVSVNVVTAPTGSVATFDINEAGVSVLSTAITIDAGEFTSETAATPPVISDSSIAANAIMTLDIDGVGSTITGAGGKVWIYFTRT